MKIFIVTPALIFVHVLGFYKDFPQYAVCGDFKPHVDFVFQGIYASAILGGQLQSRCVPAGLHLPLQTTDSCSKWQEGTQPHQLGPRRVGGVSTACLLSRLGTLLPGWAWNHKIFGSLRMSSLLGT